MTIVFYNNYSEKNVINKTIDSLTALTLTGELRKSTSVKTPVIDVEYSESIIGYNYCYITEFARYYFITDIKSIRNGLWEISMRVDVLMSFSNDILSSEAIIDHETSPEFSEYIQSDIWQDLVKDKTDIINFSSGLSESGGYVLITAGG